MKKKTASWCGMGVGMMLLLLLLPGLIVAAGKDEVDSEESRKILGSSVVTSVSVIMDTGNGSKAVFTDAVGKPMSKPSAAAHLASPINLLNPDRYEFYTFDDSGDLVKRLMTLQEIQQIIANGDGDGLTYGGNGVDTSPEKRVNDVVNNVQNVLKEEIERNSDRPMLEDLSSSWTMVLPAVFGNSGEEVVPDGSLVVATPETIMIEPTSEVMSENGAVEEENVTSSVLDNVVTGSDLNATSTPFEKLSTFIPVFVSSTALPVSSTTVAPSSSSTSTSSFKEATTMEILKEGSQTLPTLIAEVQRSTTTEASNDLTSLEGDFLGNQKKTTIETQTVPSSSTTFVTERQDLEVSSEATTQKPLEASTTLVPATETTTTEFVAPTSTNQIPEQNLTVESTKTPMSAEDFPSSTYSFLTTFFGMNVSTSNIETTETTTTKPTQQQQNTEPSLDIEKLAVTELLDQLLLSSTNMYHLNSELEHDDSFETEQSSAESKTEADEKVTTAKVEATTKPEQVNTQKNVISSIDELLSQAVADVEEPAENATQQAEKVHDFMMNTGDKNLLEVQEKTATVMSDLMGNLDVDLIKQQQNEEITNRNVITNVSSETEEPPLDESIDSFINQMVLEEMFNATTIVDDSPAVTSTTQKYDFTVMGDLLAKIEDEIELNDTSSTENDNLSTTQEIFKFDDVSVELDSAETTASSGELLQGEAESTIVFSTTTDSLVTETEKRTNEFPTTTASDFTTNEPETPQSNIKWAPVSTITPSSPHPAIVTTPIAPSVDLSSQISAGFGLEDTTAHLDSDIYQFVQLCNELAFSFWRSTSESLSPSRSLVVSPFAATSLLAMVFLGARGATSGEMNEILRLDDMVTFNPHLIFRNVTESIEVSRRAGVAASAIVRELYSDKNKGKLLGFYKERARQFYDGHVEEANFKEIGDVIRRRTNLLVKRYTWGKIHEFIKENSIKVRTPLAGVSVNIFQTDCSAASTANRDGEIYFQVSPTIRQRRLVPIPAVVWRSGFLAGYEPGLDATAVAIGAKDQLISTIFVMPGQQGIAAPGDGLARLEQHLVEGAFKDGVWIRLLKSLIPRIGLEVQIPRFYHKSFVNATMALQRMGLKDLFDAKKADLRGLNGVSHELYLSDMVQVNNFATCGEGRIDETHHIETYPTIGAARSTRKLRATDESIGAFRDYQRAFNDAVFDPDYLAMPLPLRPRQARLPDVPKLRFDRPFLYFVRHNPTGLIMHMGRFNPRLLP